MSDAVEPHPPDPEPNPEHRRGLDETVAVLKREFEIAPYDKILDLGCNTGNWLRAFMDAGRERIVGVDLQHLIDRLVIPLVYFDPFDLSTPMFMHSYSAKLVLCLEVAEHLPAESAPVLVRNCTRACNGKGAVLFSAAVPGQGGHGHINEQPHTYWRDLFAAEGYSWDESIRAKLPPSLAAYYRSNMAVCRRLSR